MESGPCGPRIHRKGVVLPDGPCGPRIHRKGVVLQDGPCGPRITIFNSNIIKKTIGCRSITKSIIK